MGHLGRAPPSGTQAGHRPPGRPGWAPSDGTRRRGTVPRNALAERHRWDTQVGHHPVGHQVGHRPCGAPWLGAVQWDMQVGHPPLGRLAERHPWDTQVGAGPWDALAGHRPMGHAGGAPSRATPWLSTIRGTRRRSAFPRNALAGRRPWDTQAGVGRWDAMVGRWAGRTPPVGGAVGDPSRTGVQSGMSPGEASCWQAAAGGQPRCEAVPVGHPRWGPAPVGGRRPGWASSVGAPARYDAFGERLPEGHPRLVRPSRLSTPAGVPREAPPVGLRPGTAPLVSSPGRHPW